MKKVFALICAAAVFFTMILPVSGNTDTNIRTTRKADIFDALSVLKDIAGMIEPLPLETYDINKNGKVDIFDAIAILKGLAGMTEPVKMFVTAATQPVNTTGPYAVITDPQNPPVTLEKCPLCSHFNLYYMAPPETVNVCDGLHFSAQPLGGAIQKTGLLWSNNFQTVISVDDFGDSSEVQVYFYKQENYDVLIFTTTLTPHNRQLVMDSSSMLWGALYRVGAVVNGENEPVQLKISCIPVS
jgi:hypothetical protein